MSAKQCASVLLLLGVWACADEQPAPLAPEASFAKGGPTVQRVDFTIGGTGLSLQNDGKGPYLDGVCGVWGSLASDVFHLAPAESKIPRSQQASCAGIAPRAATITLTSRHVSDVPEHVDVAESPGVYSVQNVKFGFGSALAATINANPAPCGTVGLRFSSVTYPGTDNVVRQDLGNGLWHMYTAPWPDNVAYCEVGGVATYWHVSMDVDVQVRQ